MASVRTEISIDAPVARVWEVIGDFGGGPAAVELKPHVQDFFKLSTDPQFVDKVVDVVGLYQREVPRGSRGPARQELSPDRSGPPRDGIDARSLEDLPHCRRGDRMAEPPSSPWMRR